MSLLKQKTGHFPPSMKMGGIFGGLVLHPQIE